TTLIENLARDTDWEARMRAAIALGNIGQEAKQAVASLSNSLLQDKTEGVRGVCAMSLGMIHAGPEIAALALAEAFIKDPNPDNRRLSIAALQRYGADARLGIAFLQSAAKASENQNNKEVLNRIQSLLRMITDPGKDPDTDKSKARVPGAKSQLP